MAKIPFDIKFRPQIESGEYKVETFSGYPVTIYRWDFDDGGQTPIMGSYVFEDGKEYVGAWSEGGHFDLMSPNDLDLFIVTPEEELTEFEKKLSDVVGYAISMSVAEPKKPINEFVKEYAAELLSLAREQFIKDGYIIEKKAFHDAVEKIDDRHKAEMSIEYSLHCKIENGTRHAVMNWEEFQKLAQKFINMGKAEALKDLPRWKKICRGNNYSSETKFTLNGRYLEMNDTLNDVYEVSLSDLEKLPKED